MSPAEARRAAALHGPQAQTPALPSGPQPLTETEGGAHLRLVPRRRRFRFGRRQVLVGMFIAGGSVLSLGLVTLHVLMAENQFTLDRMQQKAATAQAQYEQLRLQVAQLSSPARVVWIAEGRLGMVQPGSVTYLPSTGAEGAVPSTPGGAGAGTAQVPAPTGDADWPDVKPYLNGNP